MKKKLLSLGALASLSLASFMSQAATTTVTGGTVHFVGTVVNAACAVNANSTNQTVQLGQVRSARLAAVGNTSNSVGFNIVLDDCDTTVSSTAAISYTGVTVASNNTALQLDASSAGSASGVGIQILDKSGSPLALNGTAWSVAQTLVNGTNTLPFQARYITTALPVSPGTADGVATFNVQYI
jgi:major type 1 subunit fimbrin (pilin)